MNKLLMLVLTVCGASSLLACGDDDAASLVDAGSTTTDSGTLIDASTGHDAGSSCPPGSHDVDGGCDTALDFEPAADLAMGRDHHGTVVVHSGGRNHLFVVGGWNGSGATNDVTHGEIDEDGSLGPLAPTRPLPVGTSGMGITSVDDLVVVAGGRAAGPGLPFTAQVFVGTVGPDGEVTRWQSGPDLPRTVFHGSLAAFAGRVYAVGGLDGTTSVDMVAHAELASDGSLGAWTETTPLPEARTHHALIAHEGFLYVIGGLTGNPAGAHTSHATVLRAPITATGDVGDWTEDSSLLTPLATHSAVIFGNRIWVLGGVADGHRFADSIARAPIGPSGELGPWEITSSTLPVARGHVHQTPVLGRHLYTVGGRESERDQAKTYVHVGTFH